MKEIIKNLYQKLQNTKVHLWSHIMALIGWVYIYLIVFMTQVNDNMIIFAFFILITEITSYLAIPSIILVFIETIFFKKYKVKWAFLTKNPFYNIFWLIGKISFVICTISIIKIMGLNFFFRQLKFF